MKNGELKVKSGEYDSINYNVLATIGHCICFKKHYLCNDDFVEDIIMN